jgi:hypothetical protein
MWGASNLSGRVVRLLVPAVLAAAVLGGWIGRRRDDPATSAVPFDDWDIPRLVAYLNDVGLGLRMVSTMKHGGIVQTAFLTTTTKEWNDLDGLPKHPKQNHRWRGTLYCERGQVRILGRAGRLFGDDWSDLTRQWGDCCLVAGPFLFYGDRELLDRVRAALAAPT